MLSGSALATAPQKSSVRASSGIDYFFLNLFSFLIFFSIVPSMAVGGVQEATHFWT
jgi:hypothetical protein